MPTYSTHFNGKYTEVYDLDDCIRAIQCRNRDNENRIKYLEKENKKLKEDAYKDEELQKMKERLDSMKADYLRGFPISEKEDKIIKEWQKKHEEEAHGLKTNEHRMKAQGVSGGRYSYHFVPTAIGTSGVVRCICGTEFEFQKIG